MRNCQTHPQYSVSLLGPCAQRYCQWQVNVISCQAAHSCQLCCPVPIKCSRRVEGGSFNCIDVPPWWKNVYILTALGNSEFSAVQ